MKSEVTPMTQLSPEKRKLLELLIQKKNINVSPLQTIPKRDNSWYLPLSFNQEGLWFKDRLDPDKANYNLPGNVRLKGLLNVGALEQSLSEIVRRHECLRTTFAMKDGGETCQVIAPARPLKLQVIDLKKLPEKKREEEALRLATEEARKSFDLETGPLFRVFLLHLGKEEHVLILNIHHIVCDGWSMGVFTQELTTLYKAFLNGKRSPLPELPIQFADWALRERSWLKGKVLEEYLTYWKQQLSGSPPLLQLPTDKARPSVQSFRGMHHPLVFSSSLTMALKTLARQEKVTLFVTILTAFKALLYCYTGQKDIVVGSSFANREWSELEGLIGFFVNTMPLRTKLSGNLSFQELLCRVREVTLGAYANQKLPLAKLVSELQPERDVSRNPFYQVVFDLLTPDHNPAVYGYGLSTEMETLEFSGLTMTPINVEYGVARFDVAVFLWDMPQGLTGTIEYSIDLFEPETIARMGKHFEALLQHIVAVPDLRLNILAEHFNKVDRQKQTAREKAYKDTIRKKLKDIKRKSVFY